MKNLNLLLNKSIFSLEHVFVIIDYRYKKKEGKKEETGFSKSKVKLI